MDNKNILLQKKVLTKYKVNLLIKKYTKKNINNKYTYILNIYNKYIKELNKQINYYKGVK